MNRASPTDLFLSAGEPSGDLQGASLIEQLLKDRPSLKIGAVAGPRMREHKIDAYFRMENLQVMGFSDVIFALPKIIRQFFAIRKKILELNPKGVVCIDYPGFHLRLERSLKKHGYQGQLIHFISPTVWAWGKKRIPLMAKNLDLLLSILPFEKKYFEKTKLPFKYVGHPLTKKIPSPPSTPREKILALFPGSREIEIVRNFPLQLQIANTLQALDPTLQIAISIANKDREAAIHKAARGLAVSFVPPEKTYTLMQSARLALATSGTVTLELALHKTPTVVNFAIRPLDIFIAQKIFGIHLPFYCLVNLLGSKEIFPEFFGPNLTQKDLLESAKSLWFNEEKQQACRQNCEEMRKILGEQNACQEASLEIIKKMENSYAAYQSPFFNTERPIL